MNRRWLELARFLRWTPSVSLVVALASSACTKPRTPLYPEEPVEEAPAQPVPTVAIAEPGPSPLANVAPTADGWFDPAPLLVSLRPSERVDTARRAGLDSLAALPLYDLKVSIDPHAGTFDLEQETYVTNAYGAGLPSLVFRLHGNPSSEGGGPTRVRLVSGECLGRACHVRQGPPSAITVSFDQPLAKGERVRVQFSLTGVLERIDPAQTGLIAQSLAGILGMGAPSADVTYGMMSVCDAFVSMGAFFPVLARRDDKGWERVEKASVGDFGSDDLAHVRAQIETPPLVRVVTPGFAVRSVLVPGKDGEPRQRFDIAASMVRDFSVFAGDGVDSVERRVGDISVRSTFLQGNRDVGERVADVAASALSVFERRFGPYPYRVLEVVEAPLTGGAGGMEFSSMIVVSSMLYRPFGKDDPLGALFGMLGGAREESPAASLLDETLEFTTAHEVAHQWWHALVGSDSRAHPFVDESLAQYSTLIYYEDRHGKERARRVADSQVRLNYVGMRLMGQPDGPVTGPAASFEPLSYAGLVYGKGPFFFREARGKMGDAAFFEALRRYADEYRFRTASSEGPLPYLAAGKQERAVRLLARRWLDEAHGDADLGPVDMQSVLGAVLGPDAAKMAPEIEQLLRVLGPSTPGASPSKRSQDPTQMLQQIEQIEQMLDSF